MKRGTIVRVIKHISANFKVGCICYVSYTNIRSDELVIGCTTGTNTRYTAALNLDEVEVVDDSLTELYLTRTDLFVKKFNEIQSLFRM